MLIPYLCFITFLYVDYCAFNLNTSVYFLRTLIPTFALNSVYPLRNFITLIKTKLGVIKVVDPDSWLSYSFHLFDFSAFRIC